MSGKVTLCIPQYNRCDQLRLVIQDILNQTYTDFELLVVDDCSTDRTAEVVGEFQDVRLRYIINDQNLGLYPNFNRCVELAQGEYIAIYHNHDRYAPDIVARSVKILDENPGVGYVHTGTISRPPSSTHDRSYVQNWPEIADGKWFAMRLIRRWDSPVHQPTVMARKSMYQAVGSYDAETYGACADSAIWIKMSVLADVGYVALPLMRVTLRQETDYYGSFNWRDVEGMARTHWLGLELLRDTWGEAVYSREKHLMHYHHDRRFLLLLLQWLARDDAKLINYGIQAIERACSPPAVTISRQLLSLSRHNRLFLVLLAYLYRRGIRLKGRLDSVHGQWISRRLLRQES